MTVSSGFTSESFGDQRDSSCGSAVDEGQVPRCVARTSHRARWQRGVELRDVGGAELQGCRSDVLLEIAPPLRAGDGHDVFALVQQPRERDLSGRRALPRGQVAHDGGRAHVRVEVFPLVARVTSAVIALPILLGALRGPGQESPTERAEWHQADAELAEERNDSRLEIPLPERVLALER